MAIIDDFADIASRMKGELAPKPKAREPEQSLETLKREWRLFNGKPIDDDEEISF